MYPFQSASSPPALQTRWARCTAGSPAGQRPRRRRRRAWLPAAPWWPPWMPPCRPWLHPAAPSCTCRPRGRPASRHEGQRARERAGSDSSSGRCAALWMLLSAGAGSQWAVAKPCHGRWAVHRPVHQAQGTRAPGQQQVSCQLCHRVAFEPPPALACTSCSAARCAPPSICCSMSSTSAR